MTCCRSRIVAECLLLLFCQTNFANGLHGLGGFDGNLSNNLSPGRGYHLSLLFARPLMLRLANPGGTKRLLKIMEIDCLPPEQSSTWAWLNSDSNTLHTPMNGSNSSTWDVSRQQQKLFRPLWTKIILFWPFCSSYLKEKNILPLFSPKVTHFYPLLKDTKITVGKPQYAMYHMFDVLHNDISRNSSSAKQNF